MAHPAGKLPPPDLPRCPTLHRKEVMGFDVTQSPPDGRQTEKQLHLLIETGKLLASECSLDAISQTALDAGLQLCGARFGAFFYTPAESRSWAGDANQPYRLYKVAGPDIEIFRCLLHPRSNGSFRIGWLGEKVVRSSDITRDPLYGQSLPFAGIPPGHPGVRSYLGVPVKDRRGSTLGWLLYGHHEPDAFPAASEDLLATIAAQAGVAMENVSLAQRLEQEISKAESARALQRQTSDRLRHVLDAAQFGTWTWDRATDRLVLDERAAFLLRAPSQTPIRRAALRKHVVSIFDQPPTAASLQRLLESGGLYRAEFRIDSPDGIQTWIAASGIACFAPQSSRMTGLMGTVQDITERKTQETALRQSERLAATGRLAASVAHEINNPLEAVTNLIYLSRTGSGVPASVRSLLEAADAEIARVAQIAQQTLGFYRETIQPMAIDLNELLLSVVELFARKMESRKIVCTLDLEPRLQIHGLRGEIRQVFSNLIVNAIEAFPSSAALQSGRIHIRGRHLRSQGKVSVLIADGGAGIPVSARQRIFTPFFTTKRSTGTGLGLWVTRGFIEKHGGSIQYRTRSLPPQGTIFRVVFPRWVAAEEGPSGDVLANQPKPRVQRPDPETDAPRLIA